jgi:hypothetical protein
MNLRLIFHPAYYSPNRGKSVTVDICPSDLIWYPRSPHHPSHRNATDVLCGEVGNRQQCVRCIFCGKVGWQRGILHRSQHDLMAVTWNNRQRCIFHLTIWEHRMLTLVESVPVQRCSVSLERVPLSVPEFPVKATSRRLFCISGVQRRSSCTAPRKASSGISRAKLSPGTKWTIYGARLPAMMAPGEQLSFIQDSWMR